MVALLRPCPRVGLIDQPMTGSQSCTLMVGGLAAFRAVKKHRPE